MQAGSFYQSQNVLRCSTLHLNEYNKYIQENIKRPRNKGFKIKVIYAKEINNLMDLINLFEKLYEEKYTHVLNLKYNNDLIENVARMYNIILFNQGLKYKLL